MSMNFINQILSSAQNIMFNLQQRPNNVSSLFQPINNPSLQSSAQSFIQKQEHNSDSSSKNSEKEDSPSKNKLFNNIPKSEGKLKKKESNINVNAQILNGNNSGGLTSQQLNMLQQQITCNLPSNNNGLNQLNNMNISSLQQQQQQNSVNQNFPLFDIQSLQTEEQAKQLLLTKMMINQLLLSNNSLPQQSMQLQNQQQQQYQTLLQQQQLLQSLQQAQTSNILNQNNYIPTPQPVVAPTQLIQSAPVSTSVVTPQLSNRYSSMNANDKVLTTENDDSDDENDKFKSQLKKSIRKRQKKLNNCGHPDREHYAKGMCSNCYHKYGRTKKPWLCPHEKLYACGLCQNCYINKYNQRKRNENDGPMDGSEKIESDDQNINFSEIDQPDQNNQLTDTERPQKISKMQLEQQLQIQNQQQQNQIQNRQAQQDQAAYGDDEDQGEDEDEEDDGQ